MLKRKFGKVGVGSQILAVMLLMVAIICVSDGKGNVIANAASVTATVEVPPNGTWKIVGLEAKKVSNRYVDIINYSGYGEYAYCRAKVTGDLFGYWQTLYGGSNGAKLYKDGLRRSYDLGNTVDAGKDVCLKVTGADTQTTYDISKFYFYPN